MRRRTTHVAFQGHCPLPDTTDAAPWRLYAELLRTFECRRRAAIVVLLAAASGLAEGAALLAVAPALNRALGATTKPPGGPLVFPRFAASPRIALLAFAMLAMGAAVLQWSARTQAIGLRGRLERAMKSRLVEALFGIDWARYATLRWGDAVKAIAMDGWQAAEGVERGLFAAGYAVVAALLLGAALMAAPGATLGLVLVGVGVAPLWLRFVRRQRSDLIAVQRRGRELGNASTELLGQLKYYRSAGFGTAASSRLLDGFAAYERDCIAVRRQSAGTSLALELGAIVAACALLAYRGAVGVGTADDLVLAGLFLRLAPRLLRAQDAYSSARECVPWVQSWRDLLTRLGPPPVQAMAGCAAPTLCEALTLDQVSYAYRERDGRRREALHDLSWRLPAGGCLALVGASGSGKSTALDLATGLLTPTSGQVLLDGTPLAKLDLTKWQERIGVVQQECPLVHGSVLDNIAFGDVAPARDGAEAAARMAGAWEFIEGLEGGLDAPVGERGEALSGGQRQRIALARALYRRPWLLILDEATSALDAEAERHVLETLERLKGVVTMLIVTHREAPTRVADEIVRLERGRRVVDATAPDRHGGARAHGVGRSGASGSRAQHHRPAQRGSRESDDPREAEEASIDRIRDQIPDRLRAGRETPDR
jgi:ATP-binding cassette subfamily C protein